LIRNIKNLHRKILFLIVCLLGFIVYFSPLKALIGLSFHNQLYSHFLLIPVVSIFFLVMNRKRIFAEIDHAPVIGLSVIVSYCMRPAFSGYGN